ERAVDLAHRARLAAALVVEDRGVRGGRLGQQARGERAAVLAHRLEELARAGGAEEMRHVEIGAAGGTAERALDLALVQLGVLGREIGRERGVAAEIEDLLADRRIGDARAPAAVERDLLREVADAV